MVEQTRSVLSTVGPYQLYGSDLVAACAASGTDYLDLCGEPIWMHQMIHAHEAAAKASGARIVFSCGFDSVPFELGALFVQQEAKRVFGAPALRVKGRVRDMRGTLSGGTAASAQATFDAVAKDLSLVAILNDPFALTPGFKGAKQPKGNRPIFEEDLQSWAAPFMMALINTRNVHRSNMLMGFPYGRDFVYDEMVLTGPGEQGEANAKRVMAANSQKTGPSAPKPGEGPSKQERENGGYDLLYVAIAPDGRQVRASVKGDRDPGYGSTSKMIAECAICLLHDAPEVAAGILDSRCCNGRPPDQATCRPRRTYIPGGGINGAHTRPVARWPRRESLLRSPSCTAALPRTSPTSPPASSRSGASGRCRSRSSRRRCRGMPRRSRDSRAARVRG